MNGPNWDTKEGYRSMSSFRFHGKRVQAKCFKSYQAKKYNQDGQALIEYVLLIAVIAGMAMSFAAIFSQIINVQGIPRFNAILESELRTTSLPAQQHVKLWEN
jgi:hypothetical protein